MEKFGLRVMERERVVKWIFVCMFLVKKSYNKYLMIECWVCNL